MGTFSVDQARLQRPAWPRLVAALMAGWVLTACGGSQESSAVTASTRASDTRPMDTLPGLGATSTTTEGSPRLAAPRWESVVTLSGSGPGRTETFEIFEDSIQWRVRWRCDQGSFEVRVDPPPRRDEPVVQDQCRGLEGPEGDGFAIVTGAVALEVVASGAWDMVVDQQIERPLDEEPLAGMGPATLVASGDFYDVEKAGGGTARLYRLADGSRYLRFEGFEVPENTDLFVWLSSAPEPRTSAQAVGSPYTSIGNLKSTVGNQNYAIPPQVPDDHLRSVVIWCEPVAVAYVAAGLGPPS